MSTVILGSNRFMDCRVLLSIRGHPALQVALAPLRLSLSTPPGLPSGKVIDVIDSQVAGGRSGGPCIVSTERTVGIFLEEASIAQATQMDDSTVHLRIDLRPLGIQIFDDADGLHVGEKLLSGNSFVGCTTAISLE
jgi:hypothetical protein